MKSSDEVLTIHFADDEVNVLYAEIIKIVKMTGLGDRDAAKRFPVLTELRQCIGDAMTIL